MTDTTQNAAPAATQTAAAGAAAPKAAEPSKNVQRSSTVITNPAPPESLEPPKEETPSTLPQSTIDEMAAGKKALERNRPVAQALEQARAENTKA